MNNSKSLTGLYLSGKKEIGVPKKRKKGSQNYIEIKGAVENNLKNIDIKIPFNKFVCVSGISGSGKSTLANVLSGKNGYEIKGEIEDILSHYGNRYTVIKGDSISVLVDSMSFPYLRGCEIDYVEDLNGAQFSVKNPNASATCGCGNSFSV